MYGTVSQLCHRLKTEFQADKKITLIIWRKEDVIKVLSEEHITEESGAGAPLSFPLRLRAGFKGIFLSGRFFPFSSSSRRA